MPAVFIIGAKVQTGGGYMAYHIGRLMARHFGFEPVDVRLMDEGAPVFTYDTPMDTIGGQDLERRITPDDVMIVNPAYSSYLFGLRLPGKKIMYAQDFRTFLLLDCHCDLYVSVSQLVARYIHALYGISTPVIPAFIETHGITPTPWSERPEGSALVYIKNPTREHNIVLEVLRRRFAKIAPHIDLSQVLEGRGMAHEEFLQRLGSVRYLVNLSLAEGFGLVPLEAMAMGTLVTGLDGLAGRDFLSPGENCLTASIRDLRRLPDIVQHAFDNTEHAAVCAQAGRITAAQYGYEPFKQAWLRQLAQLLGRQPDA